MTLDVDALAQEIRRVDGKHSLGAGQLAEALMPFLASLSGGTPGKEGVEPGEKHTVEFFSTFEDVAAEAWHRARNAWLKHNRHFTQAEADKEAIKILVAALSNAPRRDLIAAVAPTTMRPCEKHPDRYCNCEGFYPACREARKS